MPDKATTAALRAGARPRAGLAGQPRRPRRSRRGSRWPTWSSGSAATSPTGPTDPAEVVDLLAEACEPGLTAMPSGRFFGFVIGGTHPAALAADWLASRLGPERRPAQPSRPAATAVEDVAEAWVTDLLGLPAGSAVGFVTGGTMANFTCLAAARDAVLARAGWDVGGARARRVPGRPGAGGGGAARLGRPGAALPRPRRPRAGGGRRPGPARRGGARAAARGRRRPAHRGGAAGGQRALGRLRPVRRGDRRWRTTTARGSTSTAPSGCSPRASARPPAPGRRLRGRRLLGDRRPQDAQRAVRLRARHRPRPGGAAGRDVDGRAPTSSATPPATRSRRCPSSAAGAGRCRSGRCCGRWAAAAWPTWSTGWPRTPRRFAEGIAAIEGAEVLNDVVFTQVCAAFGDDARTLEVVERMLADGMAWTSGSVWRGRAVLRISVSNWSTTTDDVDRTLAALRDAVAASGGVGPAR